MNLEHTSICIAKTKALISCAVTAQLICGFVFRYAKSRFSHNKAHFILICVMDLFFHISWKSPLLNLGVSRVVVFISCIFLIEVIESTNRLDPDQGTGKVVEYQ